MIFIIYFLVYYYIFTGFLIAPLEFPRAILYLGDLFNGWLFVHAALRLRQDKNLRKTIMPQLRIIMFFFVVIVIGEILNLQEKSLFYLIWGLRNIFRFYLFFFSCCVYLKKDNIDRIMKLMFYLFLLNAICCWFENKILGLNGDYIGGLFGTVQGGNGRVNVFICMVFSYFLIKYFNKECGMIKIGIIALLCFYIALIAELKVFFIEFVIIGVMAILLLKKFSFRKSLMLVLSIVGLSLAINLMNSMHDYSMVSSDGNFFTINNIINYISKDTGYNGTGTDLNRFTAVSALDRMFFKSDVMGKLFGRGLGSADTSLISIFNSSFFDNYSYLHYQWFLWAFVFIETGYIGLVLYTLFFLGVFIKARKISKGDETTSVFTQVMVVLCLINMVYNISLRVESSGYLLYLLLSIPYLRGSSLKTAVRIEKARADNVSLA